MPWQRLAAVVLLAGALFGLQIGAYGGAVLQMCLSAVKIPLLIGVSTLLCLPGVFAVNTVAGLRDDFGAVLRGIFAAQATVAVSLCALGPLLLFLYASSADYRLAKAASGFLFLLASLAGQRTLSMHFGPLVRANPRHRGTRRVWWFLYILVTIQMAWVLRPFIGSPGLGLTIFRDEAWGNAYVHVIRLLVDLLGAR